MDLNESKQMHLKHSGIHENEA